VTTTTLRIEESLRERIARLADALNQTPHSFMVEALAQKADEAEWRLGVQREAQQRDTALQAGEPGVEWHEMKTYLRQRVAAAGKKTTRPAARQRQGM
jgi:predicted transcriptional regulator